MGTIKTIYGPDGQAYIVDMPDDMTADMTTDAAGARTSEQSGEHYPDAKVASPAWQANTRQLPASFLDNYPAEDDMSGRQFAPALTDVSRGHSWQASPSLPVRRVWQDDACVRDDDQMSMDRFSPFLNMNSHAVAPLVRFRPPGIPVSNENYSLAGFAEPDGSAHKNAWPEQMRDSPTSEPAGANVFLTQQPDPQLNSEGHADALLTDMSENAGYGVLQSAARLSGTDVNSLYFGDGRNTPLTDGDFLKVGIGKDIWKRVEEGKINPTLTPDELKPFPKVLTHGWAPITDAGEGGTAAPEFTLGSTPPPIRPDKGAGTWASELPQLSSSAQKLMIQQSLLPYAKLIYPEAARHMAHYFNNTGDDYQVNLKRIVETTDAGRDLYESQRNSAIDFAMKHAVDGEPVTFTSKRLEQRSFGEDTNWYYASGNFSGWSRATVTKNGDDFSMDFDLHFFDRYNWDKDKKLHLEGFSVKDNTMGTYHRQGLAREFNLVGQLPLTIKWKAGDESNLQVRIRK
ncbi:hypothetical protein [Undibacterium sp. TS12]|uniref:hypothetical protein n=1 Tax=Undibacterium sp. TS12 TaxID=2908202 RepID=UPI001F4CCD72|nr:hypothetical protein [Undibacterium sp. TS12]MCH8622835.1 hypothetical protein [Undibacterium sp. TS12]